MSEIDETAKKIVEWPLADASAYAFQRDPDEPATPETLGQPAEVKIASVADLQAFARLWLMLPEIRRRIADVCKVERTNYSDVEGVQRNADHLLAKLEAALPMAEGEKSK